MNLINYLGKFHPLAVHLPIGILSLFLVIAIFIPRDQLTKAFPIIRLMLLISALTATVSAISGYILASAGSYGGNLVTGHQILGISLTIINWIVFFRLGDLLKSKLLIYRGSLLILLVIMVLTGHAGGTLTHGEDYLTPPPPDSWFSSNSVDKKNVTLRSTASEAVSVIFQEKCVVCHGTNKQKGDLRLDTHEAILRGGEHGKLIADKAAESLLIERITLPMDDEHHMPPKERKQLSDLEIDFLTWWIDAGAHLEISLEELSLPDSLIGFLTEEDVIVNPWIPEVSVTTADENAVERLKSLGVVVTTVGQNSNYLSASFVNVLPENSVGAAAELNAIRDQLIMLNLDYQNMVVKSWENIGNLNNLRKLSVKDSNLDDEHIKYFQSLNNLVSLNVVGTNVTLSGLKRIENLNNLEDLYIYQTPVQAGEVAAIQKLFPKAHIDSGNYQVPILESDTTVFKL